MSEIDSYLIQISTRQIYKTLWLRPFGVFVQIQVRIRAVDQKHEIQELPLFSRLVRLSVQITLVLDAAHLLQPRLIPALPQSGVDLFGLGLLLRVLRHPVLLRAAVNNELKFRIKETKKYCCFMGFFFFTGCCRVYPSTICSFL